jgi:putative PIN family toxin of toxin-antitoxin system
VRIVVDTNVLIAALISRGFCHELLEHCLVNHTVITSAFILDELREKLVEKFKYSPATADEAVLLFSSRMQTVIPSNLSAPISRDPDDDNILAAAVVGNCECIITGDNDLLVLKQFESVKILAPREFLDYEDNITEWEKVP